MGCLFTTQASPYAGPALGLPDPMCLFELFIYERQNVALGVLSQFPGEMRRAVAYFSEQLNVSQGWSSCLRAVAATVLLIQEAQKLTVGQSIVILVPHMVQSVLKQKGGHWLSPSHMLKYQVVLLERDAVTIKTTSIINPDVFLSSQQVEGTPEHDYALLCLLTNYRKKHTPADLTQQTDPWKVLMESCLLMGAALSKMENDYLDMQ